MTVRHAGELGLMDASVRHPASLRRSGAPYLLACAPLDTGRAGIIGGVGEDRHAADRGSGRQVDDWAEMRRAITELQALAARLTVHLDADDMALSLSVAPGGRAAHRHSAVAV